MRREPVFMRALFLLEKARINLSGFVEKPIFFDFDLITADFDLLILF